MRGNSGAENQRGLEDVLRVFYLTVSCIEPRDGLRRMFGGAGGGCARLETTQNKTTQHVNHRQSAWGQPKRFVSVVQIQHMTGDPAAAAGGPIRPQLVLTA